MCGIAGQFRLAPASSAAKKPLKAIDMERMCQAMSHRGPNQQGIRTWNNCALGFRRLSIIDLSERANQPMCNEDETLWLVFNGEIYNFRKLRTELQALGHRFHSDSDGEVILHGFEAWQLGVLQKLEGMFAFALYRPKDHYILLARDPFGIKPLYYFDNDNELIFASEIKALLQLDNVKTSLNRPALLSYLTLGYVLAPETMFSNIRKVPAGHYLEVKQQKTATQPYWHMPQEQIDIGETALVDDLGSRLQNNMQQSLISDVPLGVFLSGGLDSTLLSMLAQNNQPTPIKTFSIGFQDYPIFDETAKSDAVAKQLQTDHHSLQIAVEASSVLSKVVRALEEPLADPSIIPTYHLAAMTKNFVTVAISGEGGDELFAGYNRYYWEPRATALGQRFGWLAPLLLPMLNHLPTPDRSNLSNFIRRARKFLQTCRLNKAERYLSWFALLKLQEIAALIGPELANEAAFTPLQRFTEIIQQSNGYSNLQRLQLVDIQTMLTDNLLLKADKIGMSQSLEMRVPLLNHKVASYIFNLPDTYKIRQQTTKYIERELLRKKFGDTFVAQRKQGFEVPIGNWLRGAGRPQIETWLSGEMAQHGQFRSVEVTRLLQTHLSGQRDYGLPLFALATFNLWHKEFMQ